MLSANNLLPGHVAAWVHSLIGGSIASGSPFAVFQSAGAGGAGGLVVNGAVQVVTVIAAIVSAVVAICKGKGKSQRWMLRGWG